MGIAVTVYLIQACARPECVRDDSEDTDYGKDDQTD